MVDDAQNENVKVRAKSPGNHRILVVELPSGELRVAHRDTGYDLGRAKPVGEEWLRENAIGRHTFVEVDPPEKIPAADLAGYAG